jgi:hypothetical protein
LEAGKFKKQIKGKCRIFGAKGHKATDCWDSEANKAKLPKWYKNPEKRRKAADTANTENLRFPASPTGLPTAYAASADRPKMNCTYCNKESHTEDGCFKNNGIMASHPTIQTPQHQQMWQM